jgi:hypothetical protein
VTHPTTGTDGKTRGVYAGREYRISAPIDPARCYPKAEAHVWSEFAGLAIELGGYGDITAIDPHSGRRFWLGSAFRCHTHAAALTAAQPGPEAIAVHTQMHDCSDCQGVSMITAIRRLLNAIETARFPGEQSSPEA